ncbi:MAG: NAD(P)H-dependent oxidoreductase [Actinomycetota bacterium]|nr:NAD(P)H-dependent oxidoreductase [Actinomycetota bacterium]
MPDISILGFAGSLREGSYNRALLETAAERAPGDIRIEIFDLAPIPLYNRDVEEQGDPEPVADFKRRIDASDGVLIATPEYQHGIPGVLKNALDWASRPPGRSVMQGKPVAMMGASPSPVGTARAHLQLRRTLLYLEADIVSTPEVLVSSAAEKFEDGRLVDDDSLGFLDQLLETFADHIRQR